MNAISESSSLPDSNRRRELIETLRLLEKNPEGQEKQRLHLRDWLERPEQIDHSEHLNLIQLDHIAQQRAAEGDIFKLPEHLKTCKICMNLFQLLHDSKTDGTTRNEAASERDVSEFSPDVPVVANNKNSVWRRPVLWAAGAVGCLILFFAFLLLTPPSLILEEGWVQSDGQTFKADDSKSIPTGQTVEALRSCRLTLLDGSSIRLEPGSVFRILNKLNRSPTLYLETGESDVHLSSDATRLYIQARDILIRPSASTFLLQVDEQQLSLEVTRGLLSLETSAGFLTLDANENNIFRTTFND